MSLVDCNFSEHGAAIKAIFNHEIATSTGIYEEHPWSIETIEQLFLTRQRHQFPVIGWMQGEVFDAKSGYRYAVQHSVYVSPHFHRLGIGRKLLLALIEAARQQLLQTMVGLIESQNIASINLHRLVGFEQVGLLKNIGIKFGQWLDTAYFQLQLGNESKIR